MAKLEQIKHIKHLIDDIVEGLVEKGFQEDDARNVIRSVFSGGFQTALGNGDGAINNLKNVLKRDK